MSMTRRFCDENCNECELTESRQLSLIFNILHEKFGDGVYEVVQAACPNLTCCADCRIDDFCHWEGCEILEAATSAAGAKPSHSAGKGARNESK